MSLFGDLPQAKNSKLSGDDENQKEKGKGSTIDSKLNDDSKKKKQQPSVVSGLGTAGTSMAFVPAALRQRKRTVPDNFKINDNTENKSKMINKGNNKVLLGQQKKTKEDTIKKVVVNNDDRAGGQAIGGEHVVIVSSIDIKEEKENETDPRPSGLEKQNNEISMQYDDAEDETQTDVEVTDPYDPLVPNDLLAYWQQKAEENRRKELEREARESLERQRRLREQLDKERKAIEATGDRQQILQHHSSVSGAASNPGRGRGRGRGVSNLPSWLTKQQQKDGTEDALASVANATTVGNVKQGQEQQGFGKNTVLLTNLVASMDDVDDQLSTEVQEECEEKCGKVEKVIIRSGRERHTNVNKQQLSTLSSSEVYIYVTFVQKDQAQHAARIFNGRSFGSRVIAAKLLED